MSKYIIINADDLGYNEAQTRAITELYSENYITSTSLLTVAGDADRAARLAAERQMPVGVHLTINSDSEQNRWQPLTNGKSLTDGRGLYCGQLPLALHAKRNDVYAELEAQYDFICSRGAVVDHADNHCATLYGINGRRFYKEAYQFCAAHHLPYRFPKTAGFMERQVGFKLPKPIYMLHRKIVKAGEAHGVKLLDDLVSNPYSMEKIKDYEALRQYYLDALDNCVDGVTEIFLHPAYETDEGGEWQKRVLELRLLKSGDLLQKAKDKDIQVVSWQIFKEL